MEGHWHFITIRCEGSLPEEARQKLQRIYQSMQLVDARSDQFHALQRRYFFTTEKYLDTTNGFSPFSQEAACERCLDAFLAMEDEGWSVGEATVMPNHIHLLIIRQKYNFSLKQILKRFKGRSSRWINQELDRSGRFWQEDWFDRWMRNHDELRKTVAYIRNNPVKANLVKQWSDYPWRISRSSNEIDSLP